MDLSLVPLIGSAIGYSRQLLVAEDKQLTAQPEAADPSAIALVTIPRFQVSLD